jgi:hypothetical protein
MSKKRLTNYTFLPGVASSSNAYPNAYTLINGNLQFIAKEARAYIAQQVVANSAANLYPNAVTLLTNNATFIADEISAWTQYQVTNNIGVFAGYSYTSTIIAKCKRDVGYLINALISDIRYGGNEQVSYVATQYYLSGVVQVVNVPVELAIQLQLWKIILNYVLTKVAYTSQQSPVTSTQSLVGTVAETAAQTQAAGLQNYIYNVINGGQSTLPATQYPTYGFTNYTYDPAKCERDIGFVLGAYLNDLRYGGNYQISQISSKYWSSGYPQITGDRRPEIQTHNFIRDLINNYILTQAAYVSLQTSYSRYTNGSIVFEAGASARITILSAILTSVIQNGTGSLPTLVNGVTLIKAQGRITLDQVLLITNTTNNTIYYNFSDNSQALTLNYNSTYDSNGTTPDTDFPSFIQTADYVTSMLLNIDTTTASSSDAIQIFVEEIYSIQRTRPHDFGTDAIERQRVAAPQSMIDADFEYGLQPTKWQAIGLARGYPSIYEVPGTDTPILSVTTDASTGTSSIGASLITVNTISPHGFSVGTPITISAFANSVGGFSRAEGSFIINTVPTTLSFTYYATSKVGVNNGDTLSGTYTQLRKGAFYTGASIGSPSFSVYQNGGTGSFVTKFVTTSGTNQIAYTGTPPTIGAVLTVAGVNTGTQVTGTVGSGGPQVTATVQTLISSGDTSFNVVDPTGIVEGMAIDNGSNVAAFVISAVSNTITVNNPFTTSRIGSTNSYTNVSGTNSGTPGTGAKFTIVKNSLGGYTSAIIYAPSSDSSVSATNSGSTAIVYTVSNSSGKYAIGGLLAVSGITNGGSFNGTYFITGANTTTVTVTTAASVGVSAVSASGGTGTLATFNVSSGIGTTSVSLQSGGSNYTVNDTLTILGTSLGGGLTTANNITITVTGTSGSGGSFPNAITTFTTVQTSATSLSVTGATLAVTYPGKNYIASKFIKVLGTALGGATPANDLVLNITTVDFNGSITGLATGSGLSANGEQSFTNLSQATTSGTGTGAKFSAATSSGSYNVTATTAGTGYAQNDTITILGTSLGGTTPTNDLTLTVSVIGVNGNILGVTSAGTAVTPPLTFNAVTGNTIGGTGAGATFDITRSGGVYTVVNLHLNLAQGTGYAIGDPITISGTSLEGATPANDLIITATGVNSSGAITSVSTSGTAVSGAQIAFYSSISLSDFTTQAIGDSTSVATANISRILVTFASNHGLVPGTSIITTISSTGTNHILAQGPFFVEQTPNLTTLIYTTRTYGTIDAVTTIQGAIYARPNSFFTHRPYDGGVQLGTGGPQHGAQAIRMSKKYIRYQSGKGIMYTTGALFAPSYDIQSMTAAGTSIGSFITVTTDDTDHGCQPGGKIKIIGVDTPGYNGIYVVNSVLSERVFLIRALTVLSNVYATISTKAQMTVIGWHGAAVKAGTHDDQNGMFWQYDGQYLSVVKRSSTFKLAGTVSIPANTNIVTGVNTRFRDQVKAGDRITIKGMTHVVSNVQSQTSMTVTPDYRGNSDCLASKACLVVDSITPQYQFNMDRLDGTGPSGYNVDIGKMQMIGLQWSWYGAGFIDFMMRGSDGNFVFAHRIRNSNVNTEAYMRTGNMPVRYEVTNESANGKLASSITATATTIPLSDATFFPTDSGVVLIDNEMIGFNGKSGNNLIGCTRAVSMTNYVSGANRTFTAGSASTHEISTGVVLISNTISPNISHWGSAFVTDGRFDDDRGYLFSYASTGLSASTTVNTAFLMRLAPSVSNAIIGDLGDRELINRAQLLLKEIQITSDYSATGGIVVQGVLNPQNYPTDPGSISWSGLAPSSAGGQPSFAQVAPGGSVNWAGGGSTTTSSATTISAPSGQVASPSNSTSFNQARGTSTIYVTKTGWDSLGAQVGFAAASTDTHFTGGTTISSVTAANQPVLTTLGLITGSASVPNNSSFNVTAGNNFVYFLQSSWIALGAGVGTAVYSTDFPAGTTVSAVGASGNVSGFAYVPVTFTNNSLVAHNANSTVTFSVGGTVASGSNSILVTQLSYTQVPIGAAVVNNTVNDSTKFGAGTTITSISSIQTFNSVQYYTITFNTSSLISIAGGSSLTLTYVAYYTLTLSRPTITAFSSVTVTGVSNNAGTVTLTFSQIDTVIPFPIGTYITVTGMNPSGYNTASAVVTGASTTSVSYTNATTASLVSGGTISPNMTITPAIVSSTSSFLYFGQSSWETLVGTYGASTGTLTTSTTYFPAGTTISKVSILTSFGGTSYYTVNFTQSALTTVNSGTAINFQFGLPAYAQPGETVFSFIAAPGNTVALDLSDLKELTNTTLGGRGTYPNGPDVLAINIYRASGTGSVGANILVRWSEAQA